MRICLITPGQPSSNPRLVKEADALDAAGYEVVVLCSHYLRWADEADEALLAARRWRYIYVGGEPGPASPVYCWTRARHAVAGRALRLWPNSSVLQRSILDRIAPELEAAALAIPADLYIAHYSGALPAAALAARRYGAKLGFDAEDLEFNNHDPAKGPSQHNLAVERVLGLYLPQCDYITASSPKIAEAYAARYGLRLPVTILNVFPLAQQPREFRPTPSEGPLRVYWFSQTVALDRGLPDAIRALGMMRGRAIELRIRGELRPGAEQELFALAASANVDRRQIVLHPLASPEAMVRLAAQYDVGLALERPVNESRSTCLTNKIFTYLLAGSAVAATETISQRWLMAESAGAGFCYSAGDAPALAERLLAWCDDRQALDRARRAAWDWGRRKFNWDLEKEKFLKVAESAVAGAGDGTEAAEMTVEARGSLAAIPG